MRTTLLSVVLGVSLVSCGPSRTPASPPPPTPLAEVPDAAVEPAPAPTTATPIADRYRAIAAQIVEAARPDRTSFERLRHLTDRIGARLAGSKALDRAIAWAVDVLERDGHDVRTEKVMVPHWVRGAESARLTAPVERDLPVLGLGGTVATPKGGLTASVVVVTSWDDLEAKGQAGQLRGKIVLYDVPMPPWTEAHGAAYGAVARYRWSGPSRAARHGAVATLMRSLTERSLGTPHTGSMGYEDGVAKIPAAALTVEDAALIHRLVDAGEDVKLRLVTSGKYLPDVESANVIAELRGRELPDEIVVLGAHLDSWDVGTGAHDDGAGCVAVMQALTTLRALGLTPRRTIRVVLFTNEENGLRGSKAYAEAHRDEVGKHVMALEMDLGAFAPWGLQIADGLAEEARTDVTRATQARVMTRVRDIASLLEPLGATRTKEGYGGADIEPLTKAGVPTVGIMMDDRTYFDYHHTEADTLDKVDPAHLADNIAAVAVVAYVVADMEGRLDAALGAAPPPASAADGADGAAGAAGAAAR